MLPFESAGVLITASDMPGNISADERSIQDVYRIEYRVIEN
jgi:hypothetical protein